MHKPTKSKWRAFKCRNNVHRFSGWIPLDDRDGIYKLICKDCGATFIDNENDDSWTKIK